MNDYNELVKRFRNRAESERVIQRNNEAVAQALSGQMEAFERRDGTHNTFAVRLGLDHKNCAKHDEALAADWDDAADAIEALTSRMHDMQPAVDHALAFRDAQDKYKAERDAALAREQALLSSYDEERKALVENASLRARVKELEAQPAALTPPPDAELEALQRVDGLLKEAEHYDGAVNGITKRDLRLIAAALRARKGGAE